MLNIKGLKTSPCSTPRADKNGLLKPSKKFTRILVSSYRELIILKISRGIFFSRSKE
jgi:hypothetical protein